MAKIQLEGVRRLASYPNVAAIWAVDDLAFSSGPMLRLSDLRKFVFPYYEELSALCHSQGLYLFYHTDGVIWNLAENLIALGVDALHPMHLVSKVDGVTLAGGSAFGLEAATGVMRYLEERGVGFDTHIVKVPIVPAAILFDLGLGDATVRPDAAMGYLACQNASYEPPAEGNVG